MKMRPSTEGVKEDTLPWPTPQDGGAATGKQTCNKYSSSLRSEHFTAIQPEHQTARNF